MSPANRADSAGQGKFEVAQKNPRGNSKRPPRTLRRLLLDSHSRGAMLHSIGASQHLKDVTPAPQVGTRAHLFGAPLPKVSK